jgi:hypothetical protein
LVLGFFIAGSTAKTVLIRATGPALTAFGVGGTLTDPVLTLYRGATPIATNSTWGGDTQLSATGSAVGAFAVTNTGSADDMMLLSLPPGAYTAQIASASGATGLAMLEVYDVP